MKARQSKKAKILFGNENIGRAILKRIYEVSSKNTHAVATVKVDRENFRINEL